MIKSKKYTYVLLGILLLIWGVIGYQAIFSNNASIQQIDTLPIFTDEDYVKKIDTFSIKADYNDPFKINKKYRKQKKIEKKRVQKQKTTIVKKIEQPKPLNTSDIIYYGLITNTSTNKKIGILHIGAQEFLISENKITPKGKVVSLSAHYVELDYQGQLIKIEK